MPAKEYMGDRSLVPAMREFVDSLNILSSSLS